MKTASYLTLAALFGALLIGAVNSESEFDLEYKIEHTSELSIKVTTNVNSFDCSSREVLPTQVLTGFLNAEKQSARFEHAVLQLHVNTLDCDNGKINSDLQKALNADRYPFITIKIHSAKARRKVKRYEWVEIDAKSTLTVHGVSLPIVLQVRGKRTGADTFHFKAEHTIKMTDHKVDPPTALLGMIKVEDEITFHLDIKVKVV